MGWLRPQRPEGASWCLVLRVLAVQPVCRLVALRIARWRLSGRMNAAVAGWHAAALLAAGLPPHLALRRPWRVPDGLLWCRWTSCGLRRRTETPLPDALPGCLPQPLDPTGVEWCKRV